MNFIFAASGNNRISHLVVGWLVANGGEVAEWIQDRTETTVTSLDEFLQNMYVRCTRDINSTFSWQFTKTRTRRTLPSTSPALPRGTAALSLLLGSV